MKFTPNTSKFPEYKLEGDELLHEKEDFYFIKPFLTYSK
jgi:hypothetical protein